MKRWMIGAAAVLVLLGTLAGLVLFVPWFFHAALRAADAVLPVRVEVGTYRHVPGGLRLEEVRISNEMGPVGEVRSLDLEYGFFNLFLGRVEIRSLQLDGVRLWMQRFPDGRLGFAGLPGNRGERKKKKPFDPEDLPLLLGFPLHIGSLELTDGAVVYRDAALGFEVSGEGLALRGHAGSRPLRAELHWEKGGIRVQKDGAEEPVKMEAEGRAVFRDLTVELSGFRLRAAPGVLDLKGAYALKSKGLSLEAELKEFPLRRVLSAWGVVWAGCENVSGRVRTGWKGGRGTLGVTDLRGKVYGHEVRADLWGALEGGVVRVKSLSVQGAEASLSGRGTLEPASGRLTGKLRLDAPLLEESFRLHGYEGNRVEDLRVDADVGGTLEDPEVRAALLLGRWVSRHGPLLEGVAARGSYDRRNGTRLTGTASGSMIQPEAEEERSLAFSLGFRKGRGDFSAHAGPSHRLQGMFHLEHHRAECSFTAKRVRLTPLARYWFPDLHSTSLSADGEFRGDLRDRGTWEGNAKVEQLRVSMPGLTLAAEQGTTIRLGNGMLGLGIKARANGEPLVLEGAVPLVAGRDMEVSGRATLALSPFQGLLARFIPVLRACDGTLEMQGNARGPVDAPRVQASLKVRKGSVRLAPAEKGAAGGTASEEIFQGGFRLSADLDGPLRAPGGDLKLELADATLYGIPVEDAVIEAAGDGVRWVTDRTEVKTPYGNLSLTGEWDLASDRISGEITSTQWDLGPLLAARGVPVEGTASLRGTVRGKRVSPQVQLDIPMEGLSLEGSSYGDGKARLEIDRRDLTAFLELESGRVDLAARLDGTAWVSVRAALTGFSLGPVLDAWQGLDWEGTVSLDGRMEGPAKNIARWKGDVAVSRLDLESADVPIRLAAPVRLSLASGNLSLSEAAFLCQDSRFTIRGVLGRENRIFMKGTLVLLPFGRLLPWVNFKKGTARVDMTVSGPLSAPKFLGSLDLEARALSFPGTSFPVDRLTAELRADEAGVELKSLLARVGDGTLEARGRAGGPPYTVEGLKVELKSVPVVLSDTLAGAVQGELSFHGDEAGSLLKGSLRIIQARYEQDFDLLGTVLSPRRPFTEAVRSPPAFLENMRLDLRVRSGPDLFVRNNIAKMILSMDLNIRGTAAAVVPAGRVKVLEGHVYFQNQDFNITRGSLDFLGEAGSYPTLRLESRTEVKGKTRNYKIFLSMNGPLDRIELTMTSIPTLSREDILFVLFTGMTREEYFAKPTDMKNTASGLAASGVSTLFGKDVKTWTGLDTFEMGGYEGEGFGVKAVLGKRFGERMEVKGTLSVGEELNRGEAQVEYQIAEGVYLVGTQRTDGSFGVDIRFRFVGR